MDSGKEVEGRRAGTEGKGEATTTRERVPTEKGMQYRSEILRKDTTTAYVRLNTSLNNAEITLADSEDLPQIKGIRQRVLEDMESLSGILAGYSRDNIPQSSDQYSKCQDIMERFQSIFDRLNERIRDIRLESQSRLSDQSQRSVGGASQLSIQTIRARKLAEIARLRTEMEFREEEMNKQHELEKLRMRKALAASEAELKAISDVVDVELLPSTGHEVNVGQHGMQPLATRLAVPIHTERTGQASHIDVTSNVEREECQPGSSANPLVVDGVATHRQGVWSANADTSAQRSQHDVLDNLASALSRISVPPPRPQPERFDGDPLKFQLWLQSFETLVEAHVRDSSELLYYLHSYTIGDAKELVEGYLPMKDHNGYVLAKSALKDRYGNEFQTFITFRDRISNWPKIPPYNGSALRKFADFLSSCCAASQAIPSLRILDDPKENQQLLLKLPGPVVTKWASYVDDWRQRRLGSGSGGMQGLYPSFGDFCSFVCREARIACDPIVSQQALNHCAVGRPTLKRQEPEKRTRVTLATDVNQTIARVSERLPSTKQANAYGECASPKHISCLFCNGNHQIDGCQRFLDLNVGDREGFVRKRGLCFRCLKAGHRRPDCRSRQRCSQCDGPHSVLLHKNRERILREHSDGRSVVNIGRQPFRDSVQRPDKTGVCKSNSVASATSHKIYTDDFETITSSTASHSMIVPVWVFHKGGHGQRIMTYAVLDDQSDTCFATEDFLSKLIDISHFKEVELSISTITGQSTVRSHKVMDLVVMGVIEQKEVELPVTFSRESIPVNEEQIPLISTAKNWLHLNEIADRLMPYDNSIGVGLLLGTSCSQALRPLEVIAGGPFDPYAMRSILGWGIVGRINPTEKVAMDNPPILRSCFRVVTKAKEMVVPSDLAALIDLDFVERQQTNSISVDDTSFLKIMREEMRRTSDGHFIAPLPLKDRHMVWANNRKVALHRLLKAKYKLMKDKEYFKNYCQFMNEAIEMGFAERVTDPGMPGRTWYLPHHAVQTDKKPGKFRVVLDGSAQYAGCSLNNNLLQGPDLTENLLGLIYRFREDYIALSCDIEKMFYQVKVIPDDRDLLRILWWENGDLSKSPVDYRMTVHIFGAKSSPSVANYALKLVASDIKSTDAEVSQFIGSQFYVDDGLIALPSSKKAVSLAQRSRTILSEYGFKLHKFVSNDPEVVSCLTVDSRNAPSKAWSVYVDGASAERFLGVEWNVQLDSIQFSLTLKDCPLTRRGIMSSIYSIFDPLGLLSPFVFIGKRILQDLCREGGDWDDPVSEDVRLRWVRWREEIPSLYKLSIRRCYKPEGFGTVCDRQLHHFSDASSNGYGQCTYLRQINEKGEVACVLVSAKSRVAPLKIQSIPRMELTASVLSVRMGSVLQREFRSFCNNSFWTDSKVVLGYVHNRSKRFHTFVANRVQAIRNVSEPQQWKYVCSEENPADIASRGKGATNLIDCDMWWHGPRFLQSTDQMPEKDEDYEVLLDDPEVKSVTCNLASIATGFSPTPFIDKLTRFSSLYKAKVAITVISRFQRRVKSRLRGTDHLETDEQASLVEELRSAELELIKHTQDHYFQDILSGVNSKSVDRNRGSMLRSRIAGLDPFIDNDGVLKVGGRLSRTTFSYAVKYPVILPKEAYLSELIVRHCHERVSHQGRIITLGEIRSSGYWILGAAYVVKRIIFNCVVCRRIRHPVQSQKLSDLPVERVSCEPAFSYSGVDFFGPWLIKCGRSELKRYGVIFSCLSSRAVHLEVAHSLSTDSFINSYRRFVCRRGPTRQLRSDQGTNIVGGSRELQLTLQELDKDRIKRELSKHGCDWIEFRFNPPHASHFGGAWERMIRSTRRILESLLHQHGGILNDETLQTFMAEAENILNCRPLAAGSVSDHSVEPLTPNHLLTGKCKLVLPPPGTFQYRDQYSRKRWRRVQYLAEQFWNRWRKEYALSLQERQKWLKPKRNFNEGDIVLVKDDTCPRNAWPLARINKVYRSEDGLVRRVNLVKSDATLDSTGRRCREEKYLDRPVHQLVLLLESE